MLLAVSFMPTLQPVPQQAHVISATYRWQAPSHTQLTPATGTPLPALYTQSPRQRNVTLGKLHAHLIPSRHVPGLILFQHTNCTRTAPKPYPLYSRQNKKVDIFMSTFMVGAGGFEPPKQNATDLQSAPFGRSGTLPYSLVQRFVFFSSLTACLL